MKFEERGHNLEIVSASTKVLVEDIKPIPVKERSLQGKISIFLDKDTEITLVGLVYGMEHTISGENYSAKIILDHYNQRIRILEYSAIDYTAMILAIRALAELNNFDKIICYASKSDWQKFLSHGYVLEAVLKYFYNGEDAFIVSKFRSQQRSESPNLMDEVLMIEKIMTTLDDNAPSKKLPESYELRMAKRSDIPDLIALYNSIFESYPSPLSHSEYLETIFQKESIFSVVTKDGHIVAAASAELNQSARSAELTDCATLAAERGKGLMSYILKHLELYLQNKDYKCAYTLARARSYGMNQVFHSLGYEFLGRLVNNCDIYGNYEDMNLWTKKLECKFPNREVKT